MSKDNSLSKGTKDGVIWNSINQFGTIAIGFIISTILARLLLPEDYGLIAMILVITSLSEVFIDSGFKSALIQFKEVDEKDYSTIFFFNLVVGGCFSLGFFLLADWFATFYDNEILANLTRAISFMYVINSLAIVQEAKLTRALEFKKLAIIKLVALIISGSVGIIMATLDFEVWSLVAQRLSMSIINVLLLFIFIRWLPILIFDFERVKKFWKYSSYMLGNKISQTAIMKLDIFIVGKIFEPAALGLYQKAKSLNQMPSTFISGIVSKTFFPVFSRQQDNLDQVRISYFRIIEIMSYAVIPIFGWLFFIAEDLVILLFTEKWIGMVTFFQLFCLAGFLWPINALKINLTNALGRSDFTFKQSILITSTRLILLLSLFLIPSAIKVEYLIYIYIFVFYLAFFSACYLLYSTLQISILKQIEEIFLPLVFTVIGVYFGSLLLDLNPLDNRLINIIGASIIFSVLYLFILYLFKRNLVMELIQVLKTARLRK